MQTLEKNIPNVCDTILGPESDCLRRRQLLAYAFISLNIVYCKIQLLNYNLF